MVADAHLIAQKPEISKPAFRVHARSSASHFLSARRPLFRPPGSVEWFPGVVWLGDLDRSARCGASGLAHGRRRREASGVRALERRFGWRPFTNSAGKPDALQTLRGRRRPEPCGPLPPPSLLSLGLSASWQGATAGRAVRNGRSGSPALPGSWSPGMAAKPGALPLSSQESETDLPSSRSENLEPRREAFIPRRVAAGGPELAGPAPPRPTCGMRTSRKRRHGPRHPPPLARSALMVKALRGPPGVGTPDASAWTTNTSLPARRPMRGDPVLASRRR